MLDYFRLGRSNPSSADQGAFDEAAAKADRIDFHKRMVRNGPVKFGHVSAGRAASKQRRRDAAQKVKMNRRRRRAFMDERLPRAVLRSNLTILGVIPATPGRVVTKAAMTEAATQIVRQYGERDEHGALVESDLLLANALVAAARDAGVKVDA